jgi:hypothetical protein
MARQGYAIVAAMVISGGLMLCGDASAQAPIETPGPTRLTLFATGAGNFKPLPVQPQTGGGPPPIDPNAGLSEGFGLETPPAQSPPPPSCREKYTQVSFRIVCENDPTASGANTCRGFMDFHGLGVASNVDGPLKLNDDGTYSMTLRSRNGAITGCLMGIPAPAQDSVEPTTSANSIRMTCGVTTGGCSGQVRGSGADGTVSTHGTVTVQSTE